MASQTQFLFQVKSGTSVSSVVCGVCAFNLKEWLKSKQL
jgi:hypothetical protein